MSSTSNKLLRLLAVIPVIMMMTFANVIIASVMAGLTFIHLTTEVGLSKGVSLGAAILVAIAVHAYIVYQPKIRNYITRSHNT